ncbi:inositol polyphosphate kinase kcs1, partial [Teratosphaeriaceae sp. CCFEE 6253]
MSTPSGARGRPPPPPRTLRSHPASPSSAAHSHGRETLPPSSSERERSEAARAGGRPAVERAGKSARASQSATTPSAIHNGVQAHLSERDSISATYYMPSTSPVSSPTLTSARSDTPNGGDGVQEESNDMATCLPQRTLSDNSLSSEKSIAASGAGPRSLAASMKAARRRSSRSSLPLQWHRFSLYDLHDIEPMPLAAARPRAEQRSAIEEASASTKLAPATPVDMAKPPSSPIESERSAEREQYRSWRQGKAKMKGMTIAESQRRQSRAEVGVDKVVDARMPRAEASAVNLRSRKGSHYLGLFRENEAEVKRQADKQKAGQGQEGTADRAGMDAGRGKRIAKSSEPTVDEDGEVEEGGDAVTMSKDDLDLPHHLPLNLLEEIRNHHQLTPGQGTRIPYSNETQAQQWRERPSTAPHDEDTHHDDEDANEEHIASAVYYPHQGLKLEDSPTEAQLAQHPDDDRRRGPQTGGAGHPGTTPGGEHIQFSLTSDDGGTSDRLQGDLPMPGHSPADEIALPGPALPPGASSDTDYDSDAYTSGFETPASGEDDDDETTPTATPTNLHLTHTPASASPQRRTHAHPPAPPPPAPITAVELKPYKHQVGGHSTVYRFSRRAVCKQLNSKENRFYETVEKWHPELLAFMPRYIGVLNVTYRKEKRGKAVPPASDVESKSPAEDGSAGKADAGKEEEVAAATAQPPQAGAASSSPSSSSAQPPPRMISHSLQPPTSIPQVIFENNRHLIPDSLFNLRPRRPSTPRHLQRTHSSPPQRARGHSAADAAPSAGPGAPAPRRPSLQPQASWGFTS